MTLRGGAALVLEVVFFALAFGWRSWVQWRRTGATGFIRPRRGAPAVERAGAGLFVVALVFLLAAPLADIAGLGRLRALDGDAAAVAGALLAGAGVLLTLAAQLAMGDSWRIGVDAGERTDLVTAGPFGRVRNPIFSAMFLATAGLVLLVPNAVSIAAAVALVVGLEVQVRGVEEPYLLGAHGDAYARYAAQVGRFVPGLGTRRREPA